jgi:gluconokinase
MIVVLMGVTSVGKTTIGTLLAARTGWKFEDADDYHSQENRLKMAAGVPLSDSDRGPWLKALHERMLEYRKKGEDAIVACSALKQQYRELLASGFAPGEICFVYLHAPTSLIKERIKSRHHPYMNPNLLNSQLADLEIPSNALSVSVAGTPDEAVATILAQLIKAERLTAGTNKQ